MRTVRSSSRLRGGEGGDLPQCMLGYPPPGPGHPQGLDPPDRHPPGPGPGPPPGLGLDTPAGQTAPGLDTPLELGLDTPWADTPPGPGPWHPPCEQNDWQTGVKT